MIRIPGAQPGMKQRITQSSGFNADDWALTKAGLAVPASYIPPRLPIAVDLFCGAGGFSLGFTQAGFHVIGAMDNTPEAIITYMVNLGEYPCEMIFATPEDEERMEKVLLRYFRDHYKGLGLTKHDLELGMETGEIKVPRISGSANNYDHGAQYMFVGDARKFKGQEMLDRMGLNRGEIDCIMGGPPCFLAGTKVTTSHGPVAIEYVKTDDTVLTQEGRYRRVTNTMQRNTTDGLAQIKTKYGRQPIIATGEHPFFARRRYTVMIDSSTRKSSSKLRRASKPEWVEVEDLHDGDWLLEPFSYLFTGALVFNDPYQNKRFDTDNLFMAWLIGFYLAEGHFRLRTRNRGEVVFSVNRNEVEMVKNRIALCEYASWSQEHSEGSARVTVSSRALADFVSTLGKGAESKHIPEIWHSYPIAWQDALLDGYMDGDGCRSFSNRVDSAKRKATSVSRDLVEGIARIIARVKNVVATIEQTHKAGEAVIQGRTVRVKDTYSVGYVMPGSDRTRPGFVDEYGAWIPIKEIEWLDDFPVAVFNLEVEEDQSYTANGFAVHNCQGFSVAGKRNIMDPRNSLIFEFARLVLELWPKTFVMENVPGMISMVTKDGVPVIDAFCQIIEAGGFGTADAIKKAMFETSGAGMAHRGVPISKPGEVKVETEEQLALL